MKVKMLQNAAGPEGQYLSGMVVEVSPKFGKALLEVGAAIAIGDPAAKAESSEMSEVADPDFEGAEVADALKGKKKR